MDKDALRKVKERDFLKINKFDSCSNIKSIKRYGKYYKETPAITIIIPTYKRGRLIKRAVESAINQNGYDDYQILIVDNEENTEIMNETEKALREMNNSKIIYFRNEKNIGMYNNWDRCLRLAKSEWVCMLHDDDIITNRHLYIMMNIIKKFSNLDYLGCAIKTLDKRKGRYSIENESQIKNLKSDYRIHKIHYLDFNFGFGATSVLGAVFRRKKAILLGGFGAGKTMIEDYFFCVKFARYYNMFTLEKEMYKHIMDDGSCTKEFVEMYQNELVNEYYLYKYLSKKRVHLLRWFYYYYGKVKILEYYNKLVNGKYVGKKIDVDLDILKRDTNMVHFRQSELLNYIIEYIRQYKTLIYDKYIREYHNVKIDFDKK